MTPGSGDTKKHSRTCCTQKDNAYKNVDGAVRLVYPLYTQKIEILTCKLCWKMSPVPDDILQKASVILLGLDLSGMKNFNPPETHDLNTNY